MVRDKPITCRSAPGIPLRREIGVKDAGAAVLRIRIADKAIALLNSPQVARVKSCPGCGWFFLDSSKNQSRRWCSMETCGASAKSKAYYRRVNPDTK